MCAWCRCLQRLAWPQARKPPSWSPPTAIRSPRIAMVACASSSPGSEAWPHQRRTERPLTPSAPNPPAMPRVTPAAAPAGACGKAWRVPTGARCSHRVPAPKCWWTLSMATSTAPSSWASCTTASTTCLGLRVKTAAPTTLAPSRLAHALPGRRRRQPMVGRRQPRPIAHAPGHPR